jgi:hypothetical protein
VVVSPYRSLILVKEPDDGCGLTTDAMENAFAASPGATLYPNPVERGGVLRLIDPQLPVTEVRFFDANGRCAGQAMKGDAGDWFVPSHIASGAYVAEISGQAGSLAFQRVIIRP